MARATRTLVILSAVAAGTIAGAGVSQDRDAALYPAAQCAALWYGFDDFARQSAFLDRHPEDIDRARAFRDVAYRLCGGKPGLVDAHVAEQRRLMGGMIDAMIHGGDRQSRDLFRRLTRTCDAFAAEHPETEALR